jgi:hypothetical protein
MRVNMFLVSVAAGLILSAVADASEAPGHVGDTGNVNSTGLPWEVHPVSAAGIEHYPEPHWTAAIGTGRAATVEGRVGTGHSVPPVSARRYPNPDWTAAIGTGAAAALPRT